MGLGARGSLSSSRDLAAAVKAKPTAHKVPELRLETVLCCPFLVLGTWLGQLSAAEISYKKPDSYTVSELYQS